MIDKTGGTAFPNHTLEPNPAGGEPRIIWQEGMTLRDYFAAKAMAVVMPSVVEILQKQSLSQEKTDKLKAGAAAACYGMADAMLEARK